MNNSRDYSFYLFPKSRIREICIVNHSKSSVLSDVFFSDFKQNRLLKSLTVFYSPQYISPSISRVQLCRLKAPQSDYLAIETVQPKVFVFCRFLTYKITRRPHHYKYTLIREFLYNSFNNNSTVQQLLFQINFKVSPRRTCADSHCSSYIIITSVFLVYLSSKALPLFLHRLTES